MYFEVCSNLLQMKKLTLFVLVLGALLACQSIRIEKRRYRPGFHFSWNHQSHSKDNAQVNKLEKSSSQTLKSVETSSLTSERKEENTEVEISSKDVGTSASTRETDIGVIHESAPRTELNNANTQTEESTHAKIPNESISENKKDDSRKFSAWWTLALIAFFPSFILGKKRTETIAYWASKNKKKSQVLLVGIAVLGFIACFSLGTLLRISFSPYMLLIPIVTGIGALILNHKREKGLEGLTKRQLSFGLLNTNAFITALFIGNHTQQYFSLPDEGVNTGLAILLSFFLIIAAIIAFVGLIILSCNLACSGYVGLSYTVLIGGIFLIVFFVAYAMGYLFNKKQVPKLILLRRALIIAAIPTIVLGVILFLEFLA